jgi:hypothetical protein
MNRDMTLIADQPGAGQGAGEHMSERTSNVRERMRAAGNAGMRRVGER